MLVISNSRAGGNEDRQLRAAVGELTVSGTEAVEVVSCGDSAELDAALDLGHRTLVVAGGDGSLHAVANALHRRGELDDHVIGLLPLGTGNDFARSLDIPLAPEAAARAFLAGSARPLDLFVDDTGEVTVNAVHLGIGADSTREAARWKKMLGPASFPVGGLIAGWAAQGYRMLVKADGEEVITPRRKTLMTGLANGRYIGGGAGTLDPDARPDNGMINLVVSRSRGLWRRAAHAVRLHRGTHPMELDVHRRLARTVTVVSEPVTASSDGELTEGITERTWRVLPGAWRFVVPPGQGPRA
ncbi:hypothetical protein NI17_014095 [Thermobifida halotolerans]|uniref:Uncharacterized protein n=1 Tax=Thermobifida halotolerans TaxID=483545 RepID=A0A399G1J4_9ACTN|nr:diacylglycerol kinase family protein [Thermobifida halotolerans]UOE17989.1 hypothetical protein NI17_014095 [Thermobifida halotolerans]